MTCSAGQGSTLGSLANWVGLRWAVNSPRGRLYRWGEEAMDEIVVPWGDAPLLGCPTIGTRQRMFTPCCHWHSVSVSLSCRHFTAAAQAFFCPTV